MLQKIYATYVQCCIPESIEVSPNVLYTTVQSKKVAKKEGTREKKDNASTFWGISYQL